MIRRQSPTARRPPLPPVPSIVRIPKMIRWKSILAFAVVAAFLSTAGCVHQTFVSKVSEGDEYTATLDHKTIVSAFRLTATLPGPDRLHKAWAGKDELEAAAKAAADRIQEDFDKNRIGSWCFSFRPKGSTCHSDNLIVEYEIPYFPRVWDHKTKRIIEPIKHAWDTTLRTAQMRMEHTIFSRTETLPSPPPDSQPHTEGEICTQETQYITGLDGQTTWILWGKLCVPSCDAPMTRCHWIQLDTGVLP
jgi:hypothetical protein